MTWSKGAVKTCEARTPMSDSKIQLQLELMSNVIRFLAFNLMCKKWLVWICINLQELNAHLN